MTVTSVNVDAELLRQAKLAYGVRTNREAINLALADTVLRRRQLEAIGAIASLELDEQPGRASSGLR